MSQCHRAPCHHVTMSSCHNVTVLHRSWKTRWSSVKHTWLVIERLRAVAGSFLDSDGPYVAVLSKLFNFRRQLRTGSQRSISSWRIPHFWKSHREPRHCSPMGGRPENVVKISSVLCPKTGSWSQISIPSEVNTYNRSSDHAERTDQCSPH